MECKRGGRSLSIFQNFSRSKKATCTTDLRIEQTIHSNRPRIFIPLQGRSSVPGIIILDHGPRIPELVRNQCRRVMQV